MSAVGGGEAAAAATDEIALFSCDGRHRSLVFFSNFITLPRRQFQPSGVFRSCLNSSLCVQKKGEEEANHAVPH
jgi:hypothetical protein